MVANLCERNRTQEDRRNERQHCKLSKPVSKKGHFCCEINHPRPGSDVKAGLCCTCNRIIYWINKTGTSVHIQPNTKNFEWRTNFILKIDLSNKEIPKLVIIEKQ